MNVIEPFSGVPGTVPTLPHALLAIGDEDDRETLRWLVAECGVQPMPCSTLQEAKTLLASHAIGLAFCDDRLSDGDYTDFLGAVRSSRRPMPVVVCSRQLDTSLYLDAMELGAYDFMVRPYTKDDVAWIVEGALWTARPGGFKVHRENEGNPPAS